MIMRKHNQTINNQSALKHNVSRGIAVHVLRGMVEVRDVGHV